MATRGWCDGRPCLPGVVALQGPLLVAVALEDRGVQIQHGAQGEGPQAGQGKLPENLGEVLHLAADEAA